METYCAFVQKSNGVDTGGRALRRIGLPTALLLAGVLALTTAAGAAAPWDGRGPGRGEWREGPGERERDRDRERGKDRDRDSMYRDRKFVDLICQGFLNRLPAREDQRIWVDRLQRDVAPAALVLEFMASDEHFVRELYRGLFDREPDPAGFEACLLALQRGQSRAQLVDSLLKSEEFRRSLR
jgi:hypothetical protein